MIRERVTRRGWLHAALASGAGILAGTAGAQQQGERAGPGLADTSNLFPMDQSAARSVRLAPKPGARPSMSPAERDELQHRIRCQCGCTLDVYTCRTTDFTCQVSPAMHRDIMALIQGGYDAEEILDAFVNVYGERALMAPTREGFNILAWVLPGTAIAVGAVLLGFLIRNWKRRQEVTPLAAAPGAPQASPAEMARLDAAIRNDDD